MKRLKIKVIPRSSRNQVVGMVGEVLKIKLCSPPVDGAANEALTELLAEHFSIRRSQVRIVSGHTSRMKVVELV